MTVSRPRAACPLHHPPLLPGFAALCVALGLAGAEPLFEESFADYAPGDSVHGRNGWTVSNTGERQNAEVALREDGGRMLLYRDADSREDLGNLTLDRRFPAADGTLALAYEKRLVENRLGHVVALRHGTTEAFRLRVDADGSVWALGPGPEWLPVAAAGTVAANVWLRYEIVADVGEGRYSVAISPADGKPAAPLVERAKLPFWNPVLALDSVRFRSNASPGGVGAEFHYRFVAVAAAVAPRAARDPVEALRPRQVVLTLQGPASTAMTVTWRTDAAVPDPAVLVAPAADPAAAPRRVPARSELFDHEAPRPSIAARFWINRAQVDGLAPDTLYRAEIPHPESPERFLFRTAPVDSRKIVVVTVTDTHIWPIGASDEGLRRRLARKAREADVDFALVGGDLWYADMQSYRDPPHRQVPVDQLVDQFFDVWHDTMITPDGRRIPLVPAEGNHDGNRDGAPFFHRRLALPPPQLYHVLDYGLDLTVVTLNSGHSAPIEGEQTEWLERTLQSYRGSGRWLLAQTHVTPYPAYLDYETGGAPGQGWQTGWERRIREHWVPLFERYGVHLVVAGHDHTFSRTHPLREGRIDPERGVVYITGQGHNPPDPSRWYLAETDRVYMFWRIEATASQLVAAPVFPNNPDRESTPLQLER